MWSHRQPTIASLGYLYKCILEHSRAVTKQSCQPALVIRWNDSCLCAIYCFTFCSQGTRLLAACNEYGFNFFVCMGWVGWERVQALQGEHMPAGVADMFASAWINVLLALIMVSARVSIQGPWDTSTIFTWGLGSVRKTLRGLDRLVDLQENHCEHAEQRESQAPSNFIFYFVHLTCASISVLSCSSFMQLSYWACPCPSW